MKKVLAICFAAVLMLSMGLAVFAAPNGFANSPSGTPAPKVEQFKPADEDCTAQLQITPYSQKQVLPQELKEMMNKAYSDIAATNDTTKLNANFAVVVNQKGLKAENLAVSDLFDIHPTDCTTHEGHTDFDIVLSADTLSHFVGLLHYTNGQWEYVDNAKVVNGTHLSFSVESFSPFAIVIDTTVAEPQTGDSSMIYLYAALMAVSAAALVFVAIRARKQKA